ERAAELVARGEPAAAAAMRAAANGTGEGGGREVVVHWAADVRPARVRWLWPGRIALGTLTLVVGVPGLGKSLLALLLSARISRGTLPGDLYGTPRAVLYATAEDSYEYVMRPRLDAARGDVRRVGFLALRRDGIETGITLPADIESLAARVRETDAALVVIDPIMAHLGDGLDAHRDHSVRRALAPLARMAEETGCAVVAIGHLNKAPSGDIFARVGGSIGLTGAARSVVLVTPDPEREHDPHARIVSHAKCNLAPLAPALR